MENIRPFPHQEVNNGIKKKKQLTSYLFEALIPSLQDKFYIL